MKINNVKELDEAIRAIKEFNDNNEEILNAQAKKVAATAAKKIRKYINNNGNVFKDDNRMFLILEVYNEDTQVRIKYHTFVVDNFYFEYINEFEYVFNCEGTEVSDATDNFFNSYGSPVYDQNEREKYIKLFKNMNEILQILQKNMADKEENNE